MPKPLSFQQTFDSALQLNISKLKESGYLDIKSQKHGTLTWSQRGVKCGSISITSIKEGNRLYLRLNYLSNGAPINYRVKLTSIPSNLGKGNVWYFVCARTHRRCRILYGIGPKFLHREAYQGYLYESQKQSKRWREFDKVYGDTFAIDRLYDDLFKKHRKKVYAGKPTKAYSKLTNRIERAERIPHTEILSLMVN